MIATTDLLYALKAAAEATRLRLLMLLSKSDFNVKDLTDILSQSQPRISRHLKVLAEAGLVERFREGSWVYFRLAETGGTAELARHIISLTHGDDPIMIRDRARAMAVKKERAKAAQVYFKQHAAEWDRIRTLHVSEKDVEAVMRQILGHEQIGMLVDMGTGTGRILELFSDQVSRAVGIDVNRDMLAYARANLEKAHLSHYCQVRHGDLYDLPFEYNSVDVVVIHQVLHYLDKPLRALQEAARILKPGGRCLIVDFAPHEFEFLRETQAHRRLGFSHEQMTQWITESSLTMTDHLDLRAKRSAKTPKLTVSIWLAEKARTKADNETEVHHLEIIA